MPLSFRVMCFLASGEPDLNGRHAVIRELWVALLNRHNRIEVIKETIIIFLPKRPGSTFDSGFDNAEFNFVNTSACKSLHLCMQESASVAGSVLHGTFNYLLLIGVLRKILPKGEAADCASDHQALFAIFKLSRKRTRRKRKRPRGVSTSFMLQARVWEKWIRLTQSFRLEKSFKIKCYH